MQLYVYFDNEVDASTMEKSLDLDWHPCDEGDNDQQRRSVDPVVVESRQCILHVNKHKQSKKIRSDIVAVGQTQWTSIQHTAENRRQYIFFFKSFHYDVVQQLPEIQSGNEVYHVNCYKNFTAVTPITKTPDDYPTKTANVPVLRSITPPVIASTSGFFKPQCLFCGTVKKRKQGAFELTGACETIEAAQAIQEAALVLNDTKVLPKIAGVDLVAKNAKYHHSCKSMFLMSAKRAAQKQNNQNLNTSPENSEIDTIHAYVDESIIGKKRPELLTSIYARYTDMCLIAEKDPLKNAQSLMRNLITKLSVLLFSFISLSVQISTTFQFSRYQIK